MKTIRLAMSGGSVVEVDAYCAGDWAVHLDVDGWDGDWTVTHVPTGLRIPRYMTQEKARRLALRLAADVPNLGAPAGLPSKQPSVADLGPEYAKNVGRVVAIVNEVLGL